MVEFFHFFKTSKFDGINTMCCVNMFIGTFIVMARIQSNYNVIISKSKILLELVGWYHVDYDFIIQIPLYSYHFGVEYFVKDIWKIVIWDIILVHWIMFSFILQPNLRWNLGSETQSM